MIDDVVVVANELLVSSGVSQIPPNELKKYIKSGSSSMFVSLFENILKVRLEGVIREPTMESHYVRNAGLVIDALKQYFDIEDVSAMGIARSDIKDVYQLLHIFKNLQSLVLSQGGVNGGDEISSIEEGEESDDIIKKKNNRSIPLYVTRKENVPAEVAGEREINELKKLRKDFRNWKSEDNESKLAFQQILAKNVEKIKSGTLKDDIAPRRQFKVMSERKKVNRSKSAPSKRSHIGESKGITKKEGDLVQVWRKVLLAERAALHKDRERGNFNYIKEQQNRNQLESMITKYHLNERENIVRQHIALEQKLNEASKSQRQLAINTVCGQYARDLLVAEVQKLKRKESGVTQIIDPFQTRSVLSALDLERHGRREEEKPPSYLHFDPTFNSHKNINAVSLKKEKKVMEAYRNAF